MLWSSSGPSQSSPSDPCSLHLEPTAVGSPSLHSTISMARVKNGLPRRVVGQAPLPFPQFLAASTCRGPSSHHRVLRAWPERAPRVPSYRLRAPNHTKRLHFTALIFDISILFPLSAHTIVRRVKPALLEHHKDDRWPGRGQRRPKREYTHTYGCKECGICQMLR